MPRELEVLGSMAASGGITPAGQPRRSREDLLDYCPPPYCHFGGVDWPSGRVLLCGPEGDPPAPPLHYNLPRSRMGRMILDYHSIASTSGEPDTGRSI